MRRDQHDAIRDAEVRGEACSRTELEANPIQAGEESIALLVQLIAVQPEIFFHSGYVGITDVLLIKIFYDIRSLVLKKCQE